MSEGSQATSHPSTANPRRRSRSIRLTIVAAFVGLLLLTVTPIVSYMHYRNTDALLELADELMLHLSEAIIEKTANYLMPAAVMVEMSAHLAEADTFSITDDTDLETYAIAVLRAHPQLAMFNLADERGNFLMPKKMPDGSIATKIIDRGARPPTVTWKHRDSLGNVVRIETTHEVVYDPRQRSWYEGAKKNKGKFWTDMYILFTDQTPGITTSYPLINTEEQLLGVFGLDIVLGAMSEFLNTLKVGSNGVAFIFNRKNEVVAYPDVSRIVLEEEGKLRPALIGELGDLRVTRCIETYENSSSKRFTFSADQQDYLGAVVEFPETLGQDWKIGIIILQDDFIGPLRDTARNTLLISLAILLTAMFLARALARSISRPITALVDEARAIQDFRLDATIQLGSRITEIQELNHALESMKTGLSAFRKYVPATLVQRLVQTGEVARLGGKKEELSIFFSDIVGFTTISENLTPEQLMLHISEYLDEMTRLISVQKGTVDKYIGDAIMAFWGAPVPQADHASLACLAALECQRRLRELNAKWGTEGKVPLPTRIGIHTGKAVVGNIGSSERMNYSILGDAVNLASRLEGANKVYGTFIIVSQDTHDQAGERFLFRPLDQVAVLGKKQSIMIYELVGESGSEIPHGTREICSRSSDALKAYFEGDWKKATKQFEDLNNKFPDDAPTALFLERCRAMAKDPPGAEWDGITIMESK